MTNTLEYLAPPLEPNPEEILTQFNEYMELSIPGWKPAAGNLDERLASAASFIISQLYEAAQDGATNVYRYFGANIAKVPPHEPVAATGVSEWKATDTAGHKIEAGTIAIWTDANGNRQALETVSEAEIVAGKNNVTGVAIRAVEPGEEGNGLTGKAVELSAPLSWLAEVTLEGTTAGGTNAEEDSVYLSRLTEALRLLTPKPIKATDFSTWALQKAEKVGRATTIAGWNPAATEVVSTKIKSVAGPKNEIVLQAGTTANITVGTAVSGTGIPAETWVIEVKPDGKTLIINTNATKEENSNLTYTGLIKQAGYVGTWVAKANGKELTGGERTELEVELEKELLTGVIAKILNPVYVKIKVKVKAFAYTTQTTGVIKSSIETAIANYLKPETWGTIPFGRAREWFNEPRIRIITLEHVVLSVPGVHFVSELEIGAPAPSGTGALGVVDITMTGGPVVLPELEIQTVAVELG